MTSLGNLPCSKRFRRALAHASSAAVLLAIAGCSSDTVGPSPVAESTVAQSSVAAPAIETTSPSPVAPTGVSVPDAVALGDSNLTIMQFLADPRMEAEANGTFHVFARLVAAAGVSDVINGPGPITVFAPTDEAFSRAFTPAQLEALVKAPVDLARLVNFHFANGNWKLKKVINGTIPTIEGNEVHGRQTDGVLRINDAVVRASSIVVGNGYVYALNDVLLPPSFQLPQ